MEGIAAISLSYSPRIIAIDPPDTPGIIILEPTIKPLTTVLSIESIIQKEKEAVKSFLF